MDGLVGIIAIILGGIWAIAAFVVGIWYLVALFKADWVIALISLRHPDLPGNGVTSLGRISGAIPFRDSGSRWH